MSIHQKKIFFYMAIIIVLIGLAFAFLRDVVEAPATDESKEPISVGKNLFVSEATGLSLTYKSTYLLRGRQTGVVLE